MRDAVRLQRRHVLGQVAARQQAAVDRGCSVLTRPSSISGKPVCSATSVTGSPASASSLAVPPVESSATPSACSARARSTTPVLSETEIRLHGVMACAHGVAGCGGRRGRARASLDQLVVDAACGASVLRLMPSQSAARLWLPSACRITTSSSGFSTTLQDHVVQRRRLGAAQVLEVLLQAVADAVVDVLLAHGHGLARLRCGRRRRRRRTAAGSRSHARRRARRTSRPPPRPARGRSRSGSCRRGRPRRRAARARPSRCACARCARRCIRRTGVVVVQVLEQPALHLATRRRRRRLAGGQEVRDLAEDPRPALRGAADHDRVGAGRARARRAPSRASRCRRWRPPGSRSAALTAATVSYSASPP